MKTLELFINDVLDIVSLIVEDVMDIAAITLAIILFAGVPAFIAAYMYM